MSPLKGISSYKVFYDMPTKKVINQMKKYEVVIVEPQYYSKELVHQIQSNGTKLYGYVSIMESDSWNDDRMSSIHEEDYYYENGDKVHFAEWDSYLMDLTSSHYRSVLLDEIGEQIVEKGFTGVFFDTVGDIDDQFLGDHTTYEAQSNAFVAFLDSIHHTYGDLSMIQNWGIELFKNYTYTYMDAIMWENFDYRVVSKDKWSQNQIKSLKAYQASHSFEVMTLSFSQKNPSIRYSKNLGFIHYHEKNHFNKW